MNKLPIHKIELPKVNKNLDRGFGKLAVEIIRPWGGYTVGSIIKPTGIVRGWLIDTGRAKLYEPPTAVVEQRKPRRGRRKKVDD